MPFLKAKGLFVTINVLEGHQHFSCQNYPTCFASPRSCHVRVLDISRVDGTTPREPHLTDVLFVFGHCIFTFIIFIRKGIGYKQNSCFYNKVKLKFNQVFSVHSFIVKIIFTFVHHKRGKQEHLIRRVSITIIYI